MNNGGLKPPIGIWDDMATRSTPGRRLDATLRLAIEGDAAGRIR